MALSARLLYVIGAPGYPPRARGSVEQTLSAEPMPEAIAATLRAEPGSMAIAIRRAYRLTDAELVEVAFNVHPADRFTYSVTLQRRG